MISVMDSRALIFPLLAKWNPCAVVRFIIAVIVDAFDRKIIAIAIGKCPIAETYKRNPFIADCDAAAAIILKSDGIWIPASIKHAAPNSRKAGVAAVMDDVQLPGAVDAPASAGFGRPACKAFGAHYDLVAASTAATPKPTFIGAVADVFDRNQSTKCLPDDIEALGHRNLHTDCRCQVAGWRSNAGPSRILSRACFK